MSFKPSTLAARLLAAAAATALSLSAQAATVIPVGTDGQWHSFSVDASSAANGGLNWIDLDHTSAPVAGNASDLSFSFTVADQAILRVVDFYGAGDTYSVSISGPGLAGGGFSLHTSLVAARDLNDAVLPFADTADAAWANPVDFSQLSVTLAAGSYTVTGSLLQSVTMDGFALNSTSGALSVTAVPEPSGMALALAALAFVIYVFRRRGSN